MFKNVNMHVTNVNMHDKDVTDDNMHVTNVNMHVTRLIGRGGPTQNFDLWKFNWNRSESRRAHFVTIKPYDNLI